MWPPVVLEQLITDAARLAEQRGGASDMRSHMTSTCPGDEARLRALLQDYSCRRRRRQRQANRCGLQYSRRRLLVGACGASSAGAEQRGGWAGGREGHVHLTDDIAFSCVPGSWTRSPCSTSCRIRRERGRHGCTSLAA